MGKGGGVEATTGRAIESQKLILKRKKKEGVGVYAHKPRHTPIYALMCMRPEGRGREKRRAVQRKILHSEIIC